MGLAATAAALRTALPYASNLVAGRASTATLLLAGRLLGYGLLLLLAALWIAIVYRAVLGALFIGRGLLAPYNAFFVALVIFVPAVVYLVATRSNFEFLNLSSLHSFYRARLVRSYLGAANAERFRNWIHSSGSSVPDLPGALSSLSKVPPDLPLGQIVSDVDEVHPEDDVPFREYVSARAGGPIHLVNMCANQTSDPRGGMFNLDRRGVPLTMASGGWMRRCAERWEKPWHKHPLSLGALTAISGAAVSPALGSLTRGGISALAMFAGVRLGYWWSNETNEGRKRGFLGGKNRRLLDETLGRFAGTESPDWFLTDGGHFENTGAYALIAERCKVIVVSDASADPDFAFGDLENLVRKARIDLNANITFMRPCSTEELAANGIPTVPPTLSRFGSLNDLASASSNSCLALATITYAEDPKSLGILVYVKPNFFEGLPVDLVNFKAANPTFPQEPTSDQFFSESQWESYFRLGQTIASSLEREFLVAVLNSPASYFTADVRTTLEQARTRDAGGSVHDTKPDDSASGTSTRVPPRIARSVVRTTVGLSAFAAIAVSAWQTVENWRSTNDKQIESERAALTTLVNLWSKSKTGQGDATDVQITALGDLATTLLRTADTLCPSGEVQWFLRSNLAQKIALDALQQCRLTKLEKKPHACVVLEESANGAVRPTVSNCISGIWDAINIEPPPNYWGFDYSRDAAVNLMHPCDPARVDLRMAQERQASITGTSSLEMIPKALDEACVWQMNPIDVPSPRQWVQTVTGKTEALLASASDMFSFDPDPTPLVLARKAPTSSAHVEADVATVSGGPAAGPAGIDGEAAASRPSGEPASTATDPGVQVAVAASSQAPSTGQDRLSRAELELQSREVPGVRRSDALRWVTTPGVSGRSTSTEGTSPATPPAVMAAPKEGPQAAPEAAPKPAIVLAAPPLNVPAAQLACRGVTIFVQVYDLPSKAAARQFREPWRGIWASVPPVEDVLDSAKRNGRPAPVPVGQPTIRYHREDAHACARQLWAAAASVYSLPPWRSPEPLSERLTSSPKTIEVWLPPKTQTAPFRPPEKKAG